MSITPSARSCFRLILFTVAILTWISQRHNETTAGTEQATLPQGVQRWHEGGFRGKGVKVAILDTGFRGYRAFLGKSLPLSVRARSFRKDGLLEARDSNHGVACGEVVHAIAPEADLLFATWEPDDSTSFIDAVQWCRREGATILSCSVIMPSWSDGDGGGSVHQQLANLMGNGQAATDMIGFACAGNLAQRHWSGHYSDDGHGFHQWSPSQADNRVSPWGDERVSIELCWKPGSKYALEVLDATDRRLISPTMVYSGRDRNTIVTRIEPVSGHDYRVRVRHIDGKASAFHLSSLAAYLENATAAGSIPFPGDGAEWMTIGAVDGEGRRATYSSCGPISAFPKPDCVAQVPVASTCKGRGFSGTSAAAPQAAGLAALIRSRYLDWSANRIREEMRASCVDLGSPGFDEETGFGLIRLPAARASEFERMATPKR